MFVPYSVSLRVPGDGEVIVAVRDDQEVIGGRVNRAEREESGDDAVDREGRSKGKANIRKVVDFRAIGFTTPVLSFSCLGSIA